LGTGEGRAKRGTSKTNKIQETIAMKKQTLTVTEIIRAWKDKNFRNSLNEEQRAQLPANPAGLVEIEDEHLVQVSGGEVKSRYCM
jgi:mersacidin/lichenicidin family type 2 lantibiotic